MEGLTGSETVAAVAMEVGGGSSSRQEGCGSGAPAAETFGQFQDWCLRTYGDSGKTKTVTRRKYNKILQTLLLLRGGEESSDQGGSITAKFKFWVRSKGFLAQESGPGSAERPVLYVPIKNTVSGLSVCVRVDLSPLG